MNVTPPNGPPLAPTAALPPKVIAQQPGPVATYHVTFSLPGLRTATVSVPERRWIEGGHLAVAKPLAALLARLDAEQAAQGGGPSD